METVQVPKPGLLTRIAYGIGGAASGVKNNGFEYFLLLYYSQVLGVDASMVATALFLALVVDAVSDPVVGYWSDNVRTRFGRRHPFMYAAMFPLAIAYFFVWNPPAGLAGNALFPWIVGIAITVRLFFTFYEIPSQALAAELTQDYDARTSLMSFRYFFAWVGGLAIQVALLTLLLRPTETVRMGFFNLEGWHTYGLWAAIMISVAILICAAGTHRYIPNLKTAPPARSLTLGKIFAEIFETVEFSYEVLSKRIPIDPSGPCSWRPCSACSPAAYRPRSTSISMAGSGSSRRIRSPA